MADRFYGVDREGTGEPRVTVDTSTTAKVIELRVLDGASITVKDIQRALVRISKAVSEDEGRDEL